jgi:hypothetical protein
MRTDSFRRLRRRVMLALLWVVAAPLPAAAQVITFDQIAPAFPGGNFSDCFSQLAVFIAGQGQCGAAPTTQGFTCGTTGQGLGWLVPAPLVGPDNGSVYLATRGGLQGQTSALTPSAADSAPFSLTSFDVAELVAADNPSQPYAVTITGVRSDGTEVTASVVLDRVNDLAGPLVDFQKVLLPASFSDLVSARLGVDLSDPACQIECLPSDAFALDNSVVTAVPEPPVWALLLVPLGLAVMRWRR